MSILTILMVIWFVDRSVKLKKTGDIEKYVFACPKSINNKEGYINLYSKIYLLNGIILALMEVFFILNNYYFNIPVKMMLEVLSILFIVAIIESIFIQKKSKELI